MTRSLLPPRGAAPASLGRRLAGRFHIAWLLALATALGSPACGDAPADNSAREQFNEGVKALAEEQWESARELFLKARDAAGIDPELRFRAAYNVASSYAGEALGVASEPDKAMDALRQAIAWFRDAVRLRPEDENSRTNLEIAIRRARVLADKINQGKNGLEARLDQVIERQRELRDGLRQLLTRLAQEDLDPGSMQDTFDELATRERMLLAEAGTVGDLAGDEHDTLEDKEEASRTDQEKMRLVQLANLGYYLDQGRIAVADTRRLLRRHDGLKAHRRTDASLRLLRRAREQLLDPITILKSVAQDQGLLQQHTTALTSLSLDSGTTAPPWLESVHLAERQAEVRERTRELADRFASIPATADAEAGAAAQPEVTPEQQHLLDAAAEAAPFLTSATDAMARSRAKLDEEALADALAAQRQSLEELAEAMERFAKTRELIELAFATQTQASYALRPPPEVASQEPPMPPWAQRKAFVSAGLARNHDRMGRLEKNLELDRQAAQAQAAQAAQGAQTPPAPGGADPAATEAERFRRAQALRVSAMEEIAVAQRALPAATAEPSATSEVTVATEAALADIKELRRLFFSIVEHLKELHQKQSETHDATGELPEDDDARAQALGPLADYQKQHASLAAELAAALAEQADQAGADPSQEAQDQAQRVAQAAGLVDTAAQAAANASAGLDQARDQAQTMSVSLEVPLADQQKTLDDLAEAIRILEPPQDQPDQQNPDQKPPDPQDQQDEEQDRKRLQEIRDREAQRERERKAKENTGSDSVEKDW